MVFVRCLFCLGFGIAYPTLCLFMDLQVNYNFFAALCSHNSFFKKDNKISESCKSLLRPFKVSVRETAVG